jgi:hypothetical protein
MKLQRIFCLWFEVCTERTSSCRLVSCAVVLLGGWSCWVLEYLKSRMSRSEVFFFGCRTACVNACAFNCGCGYAMPVAMLHVTCTCTYAFACCNVCGLCLCLWLGLPISYIKGFDHGCTCYCGCMYSCVFVFVVLSMFLYILLGLYTYVNLYIFFSSFLNLLC